MEYKTQTFTELESDLVRANSDLNSYKKEVKDLKGIPLSEFARRYEAIWESLESLAPYSRPVLKRHNAAQV